MPVGLGGDYNYVHALSHAILKLVGVASFCQCGVAICSGHTLRHRVKRVGKARLALHSV